MLMRQCSSMVVASKIFPGDQMWHPKLIQGTNFEETGEQNTHIKINLSAMRTRGDVERIN